MIKALFTESITPYINVQKLSLVVTTSENEPHCVMG